MKVYFDPVKYPRVTEGNDIGFVTLKKHLELLAVADGFYMNRMVVVITPVPPVSAIGEIVHILLPVLKKEPLLGFPHCTMIHCCNNRPSQGCPVKERSSATFSFIWNRIPQAFICIVVLAVGYITTIKNYQWQHAVFILADFKCRARCP